MKLKDMRLAVDRLLRRERQGSTISPSDFNRILELASDMEFDALRKQLEMTNDITADMRPFIVTANVSHTAGTVNLPSGYVKSLSLLDGTKNIDEVTHMEYRAIKGNSIMQPTPEDPVFYVVSNQLFIDPIPTSGTLRLVYVKRPVKPKLDYYVNLQGNIVYLEAGQQVSTTLIDANFLSYGRDGSPLPVSGGIYTSETVELDWPDTAHNRIFLRVLSFCGLTVPQGVSIKNEEQ